MKIIAKKDFNFNGVDYLQGEEIKVYTFEQVVKLNALGFVEPLSHKDLVLIQRELNNKKSLK